MAEPRLIDWLRGVSALLNGCAREWELTIGGPYRMGAAGYVVRAERERLPIVGDRLFGSAQAEENIT